MADEDRDAGAARKQRGVVRGRSASVEADATMTMAQPGTKRAGSADPDSFEAAGDAARSSSASPRMGVAMTPTRPGGAMTATATTPRSPLVAPVATDGDVEEDNNAVRSKLAEFEAEKLSLQRRRTSVTSLASLGASSTSNVTSATGTATTTTTTTTNSPSRKPQPAALTTTDETTTTSSPSASVGSVAYSRVVIHTTLMDDVSERAEKQAVCSSLARCIALRRKYFVPCKGPTYYGSYDVEKYEENQRRAEEVHTKEWGMNFQGRAPATFAVAYPDSPNALVRPTAPAPPAYGAHQNEFGVWVTTLNGEPIDPFVPSPLEYQSDLDEVHRIVNQPAVKSVCYTRLELLDARFNLHRILNARLESAEQRKVPHRDFYNVRKVDGHIHHSAVMTQKHLLRFMKHKLKRCSDEVVLERNGKFLTLRQVFESLGLTAYDLSIDYLDMHADNTFHRFDRFNLKYNPVGESRLREVFLKPNNLIEGRYLAEITRQVFRDLEESKYVFIEPRVSVYGRARNEWDVLGKWYCDNKLASPSVRWMVQVPRLWSAFRTTSSGTAANGNGPVSFQDLLDNVFQPLVDATLHPENHPELDCFLNQVVGLDCVDDESVVEPTNLDALSIPPREWVFAHDPPYAYWVYHLFANLRHLNALRLRLGKTTISFRPHSGETGDLLHLSSTFLTAESIAHGIMLRKSPSLQLLFYLEQIGLAISPLSNNRLFVDMHASPFPVFFARGLNVALSTDDPLLLHVTKDPLVEEFSVASQLWKLSSTDVCELARNSVLMSGLEHPFKRHFLGDRYHVPGVVGNDIRCTNVPDVRIAFRHETLEEERRFVREMASSSSS